MAKNLVIVESPAKAKTIEKYLGKDYQVKSSYGHVRDLPKNNDAVDIENAFTPKYEISPDKKQVVKELKALAKNAETVWLATDDDREGEAISWHLMEALKVNPERTKRIVFREITQNAILKAINSPRTVDLALVDAQQARRVLDRLVGFELSPVLWKKVRAGLSAGRVQSVAVRLVVEREREIKDFEPESSFKVTATLTTDGGETVRCELNKKFKTADEVAAFLEDCKAAQFQIDSLEKKPGKRSPSAPFTTSTLQQEASSKLGFPVGMTMSIAQRLYEAGHITYMRTDSVNLSDEAKAKAQQAITSLYGKDYCQPRNYKSKSKGAQEAHEAIRPTDFGMAELKGEDAAQKLYKLIWRRTIASQMADARLEKTIAKIRISTREEILTATGEIITFTGFLKAYDYQSQDDDDQAEKNDANLLPPLEEKQILQRQEIIGTERFTRPPARYSEATLVRKLEELGIGRPSTYAPIISTIQKRNYVIKEERDGKERNYEVLTLADQQVKKEEKTEITGRDKNKLFPTDVGIVVNDFLSKHFDRIMDYSFTAQVEEQFDQIAEGEVDWKEMLKEFYGHFHPKVEATKEVERADVASRRELGNDPKTGKPVYAKLGRYGPYVQLGESSTDKETKAQENEEDKPKFASLRKGQYLETITLEDALELFKLPRDVGFFEEKKIVAAIGRFGPYVRHDGKFVSLPKNIDPLEVDEQTAIELIKAKRAADLAKIIKTFDEEPDLQILKGRWGPYISYQKERYKIPKDIEAENLAYDEVKKMIEENPPAKKKGASKTATKATTAKNTTSPKKTAAKTSGTKKTTKSTKTPAKKTTAKAKK